MYRSRNQKQAWNPKENSPDCFTN
nr:unnamed protein product [Callosobruchus analis]CAI5869425.1 unnamed protein product [Callosobruchus analis]